MRYDTILFDIDDTLIDFIETFMGAAKDVLRYGGIAEPTDEDARFYYEENNKIWFATDLEDSTRDEICAVYHPRYEKYLFDTQARIKELYHLAPDAADLNDFMIAAMGTNASPKAHIFELLDYLSGRYRLCVATNGLTRLQHNKLARFRTYFDKLFISEEMQAVKPQPAYYAHILNALKVEPSRILMIGDSLQNDIGGALAAGMDACYYNPNGYTDLKGVKPTYQIQDYLELMQVL